MKRIGVYSGTFDPVHDGHIAFAKVAIEECNLDKVFLLVEPRPRRKQGVKAFNHRFHMVQLAIEQEQKLGTIRLEQARFTLKETLPILEARFKNTQLVMLIGDDMLDHIAQWPDVDELISSVHFVIAARNRSKDGVCQIIRMLLETKGFQISYEVFVPLKTEYSSTFIRQAIKAGKYIKGLNPKVYEYICKENLYTNA